MKAIVDKGLVLTSKVLGNIATKYINFEDNIFGIWFDGEKLHIGNRDNVVIAMVMIWLSTVKSTKELKDFGDF